MTKSTLLYLSVFYIIPYSLFQNPIKYTQRYLNLFSRVSTACDLKKLFAYYRSRTEWPKNYNHYKDEFYRRSILEFKMMRGMSSECIDRFAPCFILMKKLTL
jgi:hypothetical protein